jgi:thiol-disulfide isomerase/thioredoxin
MRRIKQMFKPNLTLGLAFAVVVSVAGAVGWAVNAYRHDEAGWDLAAAAFAAPGLGLSAPQRLLGGSRPWLNTPPLRAEDLRGKVVLVNFWTYSCINSSRALPYVRAWAEKYKEEGLVVVGVHTPEFGFEKDIANVRDATAEAGVGYPVVLDNDFAIWRAFDNEAWPAFYFIGPDGRVRRQVLGEGGYDKSEQLLQELLSEAKGAPVTGTISAVLGEGAQAAADERHLGSPETYIGYARADGFASRGGLRKDALSHYAIPTSLPLNEWALAGDWTVGNEFAISTSGASRIAYRFHARDLHLIMGPPARDSVRFRVTIDGRAPGADHGADADADGWGRVDKPRMYQLIRQTGPIRDQTFEIEFVDAGVRAYDFTFG